MEMLNFATRKRKVQKIGMKRSLNILMALMLSLMVVYLSVGTTVMHCLHYDKVMVGMMADCCMGHDCCQGKLGAQVKSIA